MLGKIYTTIVQEEEEAKEEVWMKTKLKTELNQALQAMKVALLFGLFVEEEEEEKRFHSWGAVGLLSRPMELRTPASCVCTCWTIDNHQHLLEARGNR